MKTKIQPIPLLIPLTLTKERTSLKNKNFSTVPARKSKGSCGFAGGLRLSGLAAFKSLNPLRGADRAAPSSLLIAGKGSALLSLCANSPEENRAASPVGNETGEQSQAEKASQRPSSLETDNILAKKDQKPYSASYNRN